MYYFNTLTFNSFVCVVFSVPLTENDQITQTAKKKKKNLLDLVPELFKCDSISSRQDPHKKY